MPMNVFTGQRIQPTQYIYKKRNPPNVFTGKPSHQSVYNKSRPLRGIEGKLAHSVCLKENPPTQRQEKKPRPHKALKGNFPNHLNDYPAQQCHYGQSRRVYSGSPAHSRSSHVIPASSWWLQSDLAQLSSVKPHCTM